jgi:hypothetical protein
MSLMIVIMTPPTHALLQEILDHVQLMAVDPTGEHQEEHLRRQKQWGIADEYIQLLGQCGKGNVQDRFKNATALI